MMRRLPCWWPAMLLCALAPCTHAMTAAETAAVAEAAERGSAASQVLLAIAYRRGEGGLSRDPRAAVKWSEKAALQGNVYAQEMLGDLYERGEGVEANSRLAADWYEKAARRGDLQAQCKLGRMYLEGRGVARDRQQAIHWLSRAATEGNAEGQYLLGTLYHYGADVDADPVRARNWLEKSALQGYESAIGLLQMLESVGYRLDDDLHRGAPDLHRLAADGDAEAEFQLGLRCERGSDGETRNPATALSWYRRAADHGHALAMRNLARIYAGGLPGVAADAEAARDWAARADRAVR